MDALHYVCVDVPSDYPSVWMIYYTLCREMEALHYVWVDVPSEYSESYHADYSAPPMMYWMHELDMDDVHQVGAGVHFQCSVKRELDNHTTLHYHNSDQLHTTV